MQWDEYFRKRSIYGILGNFALDFNFFIFDQGRLVVYE